MTANDILSLALKEGLTITCFHAALDELSKLYLHKKKG